MRNIWLAALMCVASLPCLGQRAVLRLVGIRAEAMEVRPNLLRNGGFEEAGADGVPAGWNWNAGRTDARCHMDGTVTHGGKAAVYITNGTAFGPNVYGMLWNREAVRLEAGKTYTASAWVKSAEPGVFGLITGGGWQFRAYVAAGGAQWQRVSVTFTPGPDDLDAVVRLNTESETRGVWVDDVKLEEGSEATPMPPARGEPAARVLEPLRAQQEVQGDGPFETSFLLFAPEPVKGSAVATLGRARVTEPINLAPGVWRLTVAGDAVAQTNGPWPLTLRLGGGAQASAVANLTFYSPGSALRRAAALKARLPGWQARLKSLRAPRRDLSYPTVRYTVLANFVAYVEEDARKGQVRRALMQLDDLEAMARGLDADLRAAAAGKLPLPAVPRWTGAQRPVVRGSSFVGPTSTPGRPAQERPIFFTGYGHFGQVVTDMEKWPAYGTNIVQIELGPSALFPNDGPPRMEAVTALKRTLDRARAAGVAVCLLISPHYMPDWAYAKWPELKRRREGFLGYCIHAPNGRAFLQRFVKTLLEPIRHHPALQSICLSNEPVNREEPCEFAAADWHRWLQGRHGTLEALNAAWGTRYAAFTDVPLPDPFGKRPAPAVWLDYVRFNQEEFAAWHAMLADAVHAVAPGLPVHAKAMTWTLTGSSEAGYGVDATLFGGFSQINGNDAVNLYSFGRSEFAEDWLGNAIGHDLQRSALDAPVFNTENHIIVDREERYVPAAHIRSALWQAAAHGQSATTIWVWERTFDPKSDFWGSIMHRPACAEMVGRVNCDLNRAAREMTAIQQAPAQALILESVSARVWNAGVYDDCLRKLYTALTFAGLKVGFVTERQLEAGRVPTTGLLFVPNVTHLSDTAFAALGRYRGHLVYVGGEDVLRFTDTGARREAALPAARVDYTYGATRDRDLWTALLAALPGWSARPAVGLETTAGAAPWGVEWRTGSLDGRTVVNLCNYLKTPVTVRLRVEGHDVRARDVLTGAAAGPAITLQPLEVRLLRLAR